MTTVQEPMDYNDTDFVYIDVPNKKIIGPVEWDKKGNAVKKEYITTEETESKGKKRVRKSKRYYPWCSVLTAKRVYHVAGKHIEENEYEEFDSVLSKALKETYWHTKRL